LRFPNLRGATTCRILGRWKLLQQFLAADLVFGNVPPYRGRPQKLFDGIVIASIVFFHEPDELDGVIDADFKQGPTGVVDLIAIRDPFDRPDWIPDR
jgi:hypothetical protein